MAHVPATGTAAPAPHTGGHATVRTYWMIAGVLALVTAIELSALYIPGLPSWLLVSSLLLLSALKFALVVGFFMHLRYDHSIFRTMFIGPLIIAIGIILALMALFGAFILLPRTVL
jgi:cytochrome c oxidase subunit 4